MAWRCSSINIKLRNLTLFTGSMTKGQILVTIIIRKMREWSQQPIFANVKDWRCLTQWPDMAKLLHTSYGKMFNVEIAFGVTGRWKHLSRVAESGPRDLNPSETTNLILDNL